jgi:hypothetical protein
MICFHQRRPRPAKRPEAVGRSIQEKAFCVAISLFRENVLCLRRTFSEDPFAAELEKADICPIHRAASGWKRDGKRQCLACLVSEDSRFLQKNRTKLQDFSQALMLVSIH